MANDTTPEDVMKSTTPEVRALINEILKIEKEYESFYDLAGARKEKELCDRIIRLVEREVKE